MENYNFLRLNLFLFTILFKSIYLKKKKWLKFTQSMGAHIAPN